MKFFTIAKTLMRYWRMAKDPRTPKVVKYLIYGGIAYTLSPIDLIPDAFPFFGILDDAAVLPSVIALAMVLIPKDVKKSHNAKEARELVQNKAEGRLAAQNAEAEEELRRTA